MSYLALSTEYKASTTELGCHMILALLPPNSNKCQNHMPPKLELETPNFVSAASKETQLTITPSYCFLCHIY